MKKFLILLLILTGSGAFAVPEKIDMSKWQYNSVENVFYQLGIPYCDNPADVKLEKIAIFVPAQYLNCISNGDNTYSCKINKISQINDYTPLTAPIVMPIEDTNYIPVPALNEYKSVWDYTKEGFIYIHAGYRGNEYNVPAGVVDLKAAVKYIKYNKNIIPGNMNRIFSFGMDSGGTQSLLLGLTGNNDYFKPYLKEIGAIEKTDDSIYGSMAWCPTINADMANEAYEWNFGASRTDVDEKTKKLSDKMAMDYAQYINEEKFRREDGTLLELRETNKGICKGGSYYNYLEKVVNQSFTNFLADNLFPVDMNKYGKEELNIILSEEDNSENCTEQESNPDNNTDEKEKEQKHNLIFNSGEEYVNYLNSNSENKWIDYDSATYSAKITRFDDFSKTMKLATKPVGAFKNPEPDMAIYNPFYYIMPNCKGYKTSKAAKFFRIRTGISQADTPLTTEVNLSLALKKYCGNKKVDYETVWAMGHVKAERRGTPEFNLIRWVNKCTTKSNK